MARILRIVNRFNLGGPTYNAAYLTRHLSPGFETLLIGGLHDPTEASSDFILHNIGADYRIIPSMRRALHPGRDLAAYREISRLIRDFRPDIVHTHASKAGALGRMAAIRNKVPHIVHTFHGHVLESYFSRTKNKLFTGIERYLANRSSAIIALTESQKEDLVRLLRPDHPDKIVVIPLGFDLERFRTGQAEKRARFRKRFGLSGDVTAIGIVGRLVPIKNHGLFLRAVRTMQDTGLSFRAFVIGDGEESEHLKKMARDLGIFSGDSPVQGNSPALRFTSWIRETDEVMAGLDIVALTSFNEGTPVSLIEAQAAGKPVVSTRVGGTGQVVMHESTGLLSDPGDEAGFIRHLSWLAGDRTLREKLGSAGREHVSSRFHVQRLVDETKSLYLRLLDGKR